MSSRRRRQVVEQIRARAASDGDGVKLLRVFGGPGPERFDPFLMLDEFGSYEAADYIGGFPDHPHRGFETVTYMLQGKMEHRDHMGNVGLLADGGVQWMTAGRGIIHSEMPRQTEGRMRGFQLWVNLPAASKMKAAHYEDVDPDKIPVFELGKLRIKAMAGTVEINGETINGYFSIADTEPLFLDMHLEPGAEARVAIADGDNSLAYVYEGTVELGAQQVRTQSQTLTRFAGDGELVIGNPTELPARVIVLAGKPIGEPIVQHGPFVMNSMAEIDQAIMDFRSGTLTA